MNERKDISEKAKKYFLQTSSKRQYSSLNLEIILIIYCQKNVQVNLYTYKHPIPIEIALTATDSIVRYFI